MIRRVAYKRPLGLRPGESIVVYERGDEQETLFGRVDESQAGSVLVIRSDGEFVIPVARVVEIIDVTEPPAPAPKAERAGVPG